MLKRTFGGSHAASPRRPVHLDASALPLVQRDGRACALDVFILRTDLGQLRVIFRRRYRPIGGLLRNRSRDELRVAMEKSGSCGKRPRLSDHFSDARLPE